MKAILKKSQPGDWKRVTDGGVEFRVYTIPVTYVPRREAQSWTTSPTQAQDFNSTYVLITGVSDQFFLNHKSSGALGAHDYDEDEIIHVGKKFIHPVFIAVDHSTWAKYYGSPEGKAPGFKDAANSLLGVKPPVAKKAVKKVVKAPVKKVAKKAVKKTAKKK